MIKRTLPSSVARQTRYTGLAGRWSRALLVTSGVAIALGLSFGLPRYSLWTDEATTALLMRLDVGGLVNALGGQGAESEAADPLYYVLLWLWTRVAGDSEIALRAPSLILALATVWVLHRTLRLLGLQPWFAFGCAVSFLILPVVQWYCLEARPYALIMLGVSVHVLLSVRCLRGSSLSCLWPLAVLTVLLGLTYLVAGIGGLFALCTVAVRLWRRVPANWHQPRIRWLIVLLIGAILVDVVVVGRAILLFGGPGPSLATRIALVPLNVRSEAYAFYELLLGRSAGFSVDEIRTAANGGGPFALARSNPGALLIAVAAGIGGLGIIVGGLRRYRLLGDLETVVAVSPWLSAAALFCAYAIFPGFLAGRYLTGRHLVFALPALFVLVAVGLSHASRITHISAAMTIWLIGAIAFGGFVFDERFAKEDFRSVSRIVVACRFEPDQLFLLAYKPGFLYYGVAGMFGVADGASVGDVGAAAEFLSQTAATHAPAMVVLDAARFDTQGVVDAVGRRLGLVRRSVPTMTMLSTVDLNACSPP